MCVIINNFKIGVKVMQRIFTAKYPPTKSRGAQRGRFFLCPCKESLLPPVKIKRGEEIEGHKGDGSFCAPVKSISYRL
jgi:hypothetical protein